MKKNIAASSPWELNKNEKAGEGDVNRIVGEEEREKIKYIL